MASTSYRDKNLKFKIYSVMSEVVDERISKIEYICVFNIVHHIIQAYMLTSDKQYSLNENFNKLCEEQVSLIQSEAHYEAALDLSKIKPYVKRTLKKMGFKQLVPSVLFADCKYSKKLEELMIYRNENDIPVNAEEFFFIIRQTVRYDMKNDDIENEMFRLNRVLKNPIDVGKIYRIVKGKKFYRYKNETIIKKLDITPEEQKIINLFPFENESVDSNEIN